MKSFKQIEIKVKRIPIVGEHAELYQSAVNHSGAAESIARTLFDGLDSERFIAILLDAQLNIMGAVEVAKGCAESCPADPREVFRAAVMMNASSVIVAHNHPSGHLEPSTDDLNITKRLRDAGELLNIKLIDHLIICENKCLSFAETGRLL